MAAKKVRLLNEHERARRLRTFDDLIARIPTRDVREVERELSAIREARRTGGRKSAEGN